MRIFRIADGRDAFYQWDVEQRLIVSNIIPRCSQVHFCNGKSQQALVVSVKEDSAKGIRYCDVPNILLQDSLSIRCYSYTDVDGKKTIHESIFDVTPRNKPNDYVYTETEILRYETLQKKIDDILSDIRNVTFITNEDINRMMEV